MREILSTAWPALLVREEREEIDRHRQECDRVMLARDLAHGLEEAQLERVI
jgi:hypothetical protein